MSESEGGGPLGVIFSVAFFRGLDPTEVVRRFSRGEDPGSDPDRLNAFMLELGMGLDKPEDAAAWEDNYDTAVPRGFALAAKVTGVPFTPDMLGRPMLVGPIAER
ncbi:DUF6461 domain-containing protein [Nonomuraea sp. H19]|uniref:DUF6461 domain-containing protein n=1 Tax=Nonomuraea sp. H19 TaxID=3452206 RepID=UPI003F8B13DA